MQLKASKDFAYVVESADLLRTDFKRLAELLETRRSVLVTSPSADQHLGSHIKRGLVGIDYEYHVLPFSEQNKTLETVHQLCALTKELERTSVLVAIGGGVCMDLTSMTAAIIRRGVDCIRIPTTLIGQVDAGIGLKCGANLDGYKSRVGAFHPPRNVLVDPEILRTLPLEHISNGLAEIIKIAIVTSTDLLQRVDEHLDELIHTRFQNPTTSARSIVTHSISLMLEQLEQNPFEENEYQRLLDFGHTFSPLIEEESNFQIHHGHAVALDIALSCAIGGHQKTIGWSDVELIYGLISRANLPLESPLLSAELCARAIANAKAHRAGSVNLVVPNGLGEGVFLNDQLTQTEVMKGLRTMRDIARRVST